MSSVVKITIVAAVIFYIRYSATTSLTHLRQNIAYTFGLNLQAGGTSYAVERGGGNEAKKRVRSQSK